METLFFLFIDVIFNNFDINQTNRNLAVEVILGQLGLEYMAGDMASKNIFKKLLKSTTGYVNLQNIETSKKLSNN